MNYAARSIQQLKRLYDTYLLSEKRPVESAPHPELSSWHDSEPSTKGQISSEKPPRSSLHPKACSNRCSIKYLPEQAIWKSQVKSRRAATRPCYDDIKTQEFRVKGTQNSLFVQRTTAIDSPTKTCLTGGLKVASERGNFSSSKYFWQQWRHQNKTDLRVKATPDYLFIRKTAAIDV
jgi:hypothetical protein